MLPTRWTTLYRIWVSQSPLSGRTPSCPGRTFQTHRRPPWRPCRRPSGRTRSPPRPPSAQRSCPRRTGTPSRCSTASPAGQAYLPRLPCCQTYLQRRGSEKSQVRQCLGFCTVDLLANEDQKSAVQIPKHCLTCDCLPALVIWVTCFVRPAPDARDTRLIRLAPDARVTRVTRLVWPAPDTGSSSSGRRFAALGTSCKLS